MVPLNHACRLFPRSLCQFLLEFELTLTPDYIHLNVSNLFSLRILNKITKNLISIIKLLIVISLVVYVCLRIQWQDTLIVNHKLENETISSGEIIGHWNQFPLSFITDQGEQIQIKSASDSTGYQINPGFFTYLKQTNPYWLALGALAFILVIMFGAFRWHWLVNSQNLSLSLAQAMKLTWIGIFFNNFVPGQTGGDLIKAYYIAKNSPQKRLIAVLTVIADRLIGLTALIIVSLITVSLFFERFRDIALILWLGIIVGILFAIALFNRSIRRTLGLNKLIKKLPTKISALIYELDGAIRNYQNHKRGIVIWWILSIFNHVINMLGMYALSRAINMGVPAVEFFALVPVIFIVSALPIAPNGWGIGEALFGNLFGQYGSVYLPDSTNAQQIMNTRGVALSILFRLLSMCISLVGGLLLLFSKDKMPQIEETKVI